MRETWDILLSFYLRNKMNVYRPKDKTISEFIYEITNAYVKHQANMKPIIEQKFKYQPITFNDASDRKMWKYEGHILKTLRPTTLISHVAMTAFDYDMKRIGAKNYEDYKKYSEMKI